MHPTRVVPAAFLAAIFLGTMLLMLPFSTSGGEGADFITALFTATSAVCVTGLITVDTPVYWSAFGQVIIMLLFQFGGLGIMTAATLLGLVAGRQLSLSGRAIALTEHGHLNRSEAGSLMKLVFIVSIAIEAVVALLLWLRWWIGYGMGAGEAAWHGIFHSISAFNNAGFSTFSDSLMSWQGDGLILGPVMAAIVIGGIGFPVLHELWTRRKTEMRRRQWSLHSRITLSVTLALTVSGTVLLLAAEWNNPETLGGMSFADGLLNALFHSVTMRTAGFNAVDVGAFADQTLAINYLFMMIGGGSAGTAGGLKVTTFALLGFVVWSEIRGHAETTIFSRRVGSQVVRQALSVVLIAIALVGLVTLLVSWIEPDIEFRFILFETISAFATVGLSTGITADLSIPSQLLLIVLMFVGRVGTITFATALALNTRATKFRYPEEQPIVG
ncbi:TrkH family potassium uptake protein [Croceicoccus naphthovorans]|nr:potassium transporter TrkG [Croceicoccus naphthovorans]